MVVQDLGLHAAIAKVHDMQQLDREFLVSRDLKDPSRAVVAAVGGVEDLILHVVHEHERLDAAGELGGRDHAKGLGVDRVGTHDLTAVHGTNHALIQRVLQPGIEVDVVEICRCIADGLRHLAVPDV